MLLFPPANDISCLQFLQSIIINLFNFDKNTLKQIFFIKKLSLRKEKWENL